MWRTGVRGVRKWGEELSLKIKFDIENYWREYISKSTSNKIPKNEKYYVLSMFPYPSGQLHMGHVRVYSISDSVARFHRMRGMQVIHPMGWDAFGLPAENAAIDNKISPKIWTEQNISRMKEQLHNLGCNFDWDREINTSHPSYYKWTQALFLELFKSGLVYKKEAFVNWDPVDQTVLADEQVDINGCSWRSGAQIEKKLLNQWFVRTTHFAKQLYDGLNDSTLENWGDIIQLQKHWIGECNGITINFELMYTKSSSTYVKNITGWTDKPESLLYSKFLLIPPHSIMNNDDLVLYEKDDFKKLCIVALNPITNEELPVFVDSTFEFPEGSNAYIGSPVINDVDKLFALKANIPFVDDSSISNIDELRNKVCNIAKSKNIGGFQVSSKLKDWLISRQRFWGTPIPVVFCKSCGTKPVPFEQLPVVLPEVEVLDRNSPSPLKNNKDWINTKCPECGGDAVRETDTMDTFVDSSWYFLRYLDNKNKTDMFSKNSVWSNVPVDVYVGGKEHAVLHLYYARFINHFLHSIGKLPEREPFRRLLVQGMVFGKSFQIVENGKYIPETDVTIVDDKAFTKKDNLPVTITWEKMSKSKYNGVDPSEMIATHGCDTTRLLMLSDVSPVSNRHWSLDTLPGVLNWQSRLWMTVDEFITGRTNFSVSDKEEIIASKPFIAMEEKLWDSRNYFVVNTTYGYNISHQLSIAISRMQGLTNSLRRVPSNFVPYSREYERALATQIIMLAPIAPHFASELWAGFISAENRINTTTSVINWDENVLDQNWPSIDRSYKLDFVCFVDGKDVLRIKILPDEIDKLDTDAALNLVLSNPNVQKKTKRGISNIRCQIVPDSRVIVFITTVKKAVVKKAVSSEIQ